MLNIRAKDVFPNANELPKYVATDGKRELLIRDLLRFQRLQC